MTQNAIYDAKKIHFEIIFEDSKKVTDSEESAMYKE